MPFPCLANAPIVEGLVNIQVRPLIDPAGPALGKMRDRMRDSYPGGTDLNQTEVNVGSSEAPQPAIISTRVGYRLERQAPPFVLLVQQNGLTVSRLAPYSTWEDLVAEARPIWNQFVEMCQPQRITRVAARFINRIALPLDGLNFDDYLIAGPTVPTGLPDTVGLFVSRIVVPEAETGADIAISQILEAIDPQLRSVSLLIDIDVYKEVDFAPDAEETWTLLAKMRELKNRAFFGSLTSRALELFQ